MRIERAVAAVVASLLVSVAPGVRADEDVKAEMEEMREMMRALQDKLEAQDRRIQEQDQVLQEAGLEEDGGSALSSLSSFLEATDFYGSVAGVYVQDFKFNGGDEGVISGAFPFSAYNTFSLEQLWFGMDKAPTEESRGGFHADIAFGEVTGNGDTDTPELYSAYASVLLPIANGIQVDAGELWTLIGAEVVDTTGNFNISRGLVWSLQPVNHVGVIASTPITDEISFAIGAVNDPLSDTNEDFETTKTVTGQIAYSGDDVYVGVSGIWGSQANNGTEKDKYGMVDLVVTWDPTDALSLWLNYDYNWYQSTNNAFTAGIFVLPDSGESDVHATAVAGRYAVTEDLGIALRGELLVFDLSDGNPSQTGTLRGNGVDNELVGSLTGTVDYAVVDDVTLRAELRWDKASNKFFLDNDGRLRDDQLFGVLELLYAF